VSDEEVQAMAVIKDHSISLRRSRNRRDELEYRWVFWCAYPFFLVAAIVSRLLPNRKPPAALGGLRPSVFTQARVAANSSIPFAFMN
jgi:light-harvesting complex 1 beta chain